MSWVSDIRNAGVILKILLLTGKKRLKTIHMLAEKLLIQGKVRCYVLFRNCAILFDIESSCIPPYQLGHCLLESSYYIVYWKALIKIFEYLGCVIYFPQN